MSSVKGKKKSARAPAVPEQLQRDPAFPIVGLGASAGGLEAFEQFFRHMPQANGMAFVLIVHLDPGHASLMTEILQRTTAMPVAEAQDQMPVAPNHIYVIPPNREMTIFHGALQVSAPGAPRGRRMPIDYFLRSLAEERGERAIGVILSGTGTDGTLGLRAIHGAGGGSFIQDPSTAKYDGMPTSAIQSGFATYVLPVEQMPAQLIAYGKTIFGKKAKPAPIIPAAASTFNRIMMLLRSRTGNDFTLYKKSTILRRLERRLNVHNIEDLDTYARYLQDHPEEVRILTKEFLINVTSFFRDPEAFAVLKADILPQLCADKPENYTLRIWVPGCSTGEEAYSLAIILREHIDAMGKEYKVQIYGTDIDEDTIAKARAGIYPPNVAADISAERLKRFFIREESGYRIKKDIREVIVFAVQNVIKDPPFTKLDLVSCRNLLIYLETELQIRLIETFHHALKPGGMLFLSPSESIGNQTDLFKSVNKKWKIYQVTATVSSLRPAMAGGSFWSGEQAAGQGLDEVLRKAHKTNFAALAERALLQSYAPPAVVTDERGNILYVHGDTGKYLRPAPGQASLNVIAMAREGLQPELRAAVYKAAAGKEPVVCPDLSAETNGGSEAVTVTVRPLPNPDASQALMIVTFHPQASQTTEKPVQAQRPAKAGQPRRREELEQELLETKENLHATIEEAQAANEELKSANEELQSTNEELQSTNEEIETSKEELQSVNEELMTVNSELQSKIEELAEMQNDLKNLLDNTTIGTIFLDENLAIKRSNREATKIFRLVASDIGRSLGDIKSNIEGEDFLEDARGVLETLVPWEMEVQAITNEWYLARIMPYRTLDNMIEGVVLTFTDITRLKETEEAARQAREYAENIVNTVREPLVVLDGSLQMVSASRSFFNFFRVTPQESIGNYLYNLGKRQWDIPRLRELLETILPRDQSFDNFEVEQAFPAIGFKRMLLNARRIPGKKGETQLILLAMEDVTGRLQGRGKKPAKTEKP